MNKTIAAILFLWAGLLLVLILAVGIFSIRCL